MTGHVDIVFDGSPENWAGRFVEVEDDTGASIRLGDWVVRPDGYWALRIDVREIRADAWDQGLSAGLRECNDKTRGVVNNPALNPYRKADR